MKSSSAVFEWAGVTLRLLTVTILAYMVSSIPQLLWLKWAANTDMSVGLNSVQSLGRILGWATYLVGYFYVGYWHVHRLSHRNPWIRTLGVVALYGMTWTLFWVGMHLWTYWSVGEIREAYQAYGIPAFTFSSLLNLMVHPGMVLILTGAGVWNAERAKNSQGVS